MKRREFIKRSAVTLAALGAASLTGCASGGDSTTGGKLVKVAMCVADTTPTAQALKEVFIPQVEKATKGRYSIQLYPSSVLGSEKVVYDYTKAGIVEMCVVGTSMWSETPKMSAPDFPFMFRDVEHASRCYQGALGDYLRDEVESTQPLKLLCWMPNGVRAFSSNRKLTAMGDFKGQKLRMPNNPIHVRLAESLGANVVIMDMGEVFTALEQGVVDGQDNPLSTVRNEGWYEVQKYIYNTNHIIASLELFASNDFLAGVSEADRKVFNDAARETAEYAWTLYMESLEGDVQFMKDFGLTVTDPSAEEHEAMKQAVEPVYDYLRSQHDWIDDVLELVDSVE
jgi:tripartite ATP-independent transporter DctP family solute receptor